MTRSSDKERRTGYVDLCDEIRNLGVKVDGNTTATVALTKRVAAVETVTSEWRGGLRAGRSFVGFLIAVGAMLGAWGMFGK